MGAGIVTLGHISDLHATSASPRGIGSLLNKRGLGWLSWRLRRSRWHQSRVLEALIEDLHRAAPDRVVLTGDLTNLSLEHEFTAARDWLTKIGPPDWLMAVPGNHDAYVRVPLAHSWQLWSDYLASDAAGVALRKELCEGTGTGTADGPAFPSVRVHGDIALVGLCSARPTPLLQASGELGLAQCADLERILMALGARGLVRVVLIHHPPVPGVVHARRALRDAEALCAVLRSAGAELVLHGHLHKTRLGSVPGPRGDIPVVCVRSASDAGRTPARCAQYHLYDIEPAQGERRAKIRVRTRGYDPVSGRFVAEGPAEGIALSPG